MAITRKDEARALDADERELVEKSHHPMVQELSDRELADLVKLVRARRDKAQTEASRRRREMRGKGAAKGATPSRADDGSRVKLDVLAMAVRRLNAENERRRQLAAKVSLAENARNALALKKAGEAEAPAETFNARTAHHGMRKNASDRRQNLVRPMELGRQRKAGAVAQAKRDSR
ncbi:hypothetical protein EJC49_23595 [Aquibium carbonis]|uniref:Uncharacterized protein n=1 Tax=Aquibium carbonis TaxID=2495581 RepID=A0A429YL19_9HYPH|nr:hypothetical protein [Aquibium carbonis]RST82127.1 hypothetical protein EJC49_23595 [Aquibium carbonis]